jgi:dynein heavy chain
MNLVMFMNAIEHVIKVSRVLSFTSGNGLLVGVGGSGRKSMTQLAASICE